MHTHAKPPQQALLIAVVLTFIFAVIEAFGGWWSGSLALLGDAGHMGSDTLALLIAFVAAKLSVKPPSAKHTYGLGRAEVIAAWLSSMLMVAISIAIIIEAIHRFETPHPVKGGIVSIIAGIGLIVNLLIAWILMRSEKTLNTRAALLHVFSDALGSVAALVSGLVIFYGGPLMIDPVLSIFISILILLSTVQLLRESLRVLMEGVPKGLKISDINNLMSNTNKVSAIHDLHVWTLSSGHVMLSAHIMIDNFNDWPTILSDLKLGLRNQYHIEHVTLQPESAVEVVKFHKQAPPRVYTFPQQHIDWPACINQVGSEQAANEIFTLFITSLDEHRQAIMRAMHADDKKQLAFHIHKLHGACCYVGVPRLKAIVQALDDIYKNQRDAATAQLLQQFNQEVTHILKLSQKEQYKKA